MSHSFNLLLLVLFLLCGQPTEVARFNLTHTVLVVPVQFNVLFKVFIECSPVCDL
jgi:hypothetical protein